MAYTLLAFLPARLSLRKDSRFNRFAGVSGQFVFIRKKIYRAFGGHEAVKNEIVEDLNFGKQVVRRGYRLVYGDGSDFSFCRMYTNAREVWEGFLQKLLPGGRVFAPLFPERFPGFDLGRGPALSRGRLGAFLGALLARFGDGLGVFRRPMAPGRQVQLSPRFGSLSPPGVLVVRPDRVEFHAMVLVWCRPLEGKETSAKQLTKTTRKY